MTQRSLRNSRKGFSIGQMKKKDAPGRLYKSTTENKSYFNRDRIFKISEISKLNNNTYLYWLKENGRKTKKRYLRQELFTLKDQFVEEWHQSSFILKKLHLKQIITLC